MNQVELDDIYDRLLGEGDQLEKLVRKRANAIKNDPGLRNRFECPLLPEDANLGGNKRSRVQELEDLDNIGKRYGTKTSLDTIPLAPLNSRLKRPQICPILALRAKTINKHI